MKRFLMIKQEYCNGAYVTQIMCYYCGNPVSGKFYTGKGFVFRGSAECPECCEGVPEDLANAYIEAMEQSTKKHLEG